MTLLQPLPNFLALDGCNCLTSSFRRVCVHNQYTISEEMILGLGAGIGFTYWHQKGLLPFLGGRGNVHDFHLDFGRRTAIRILEHTSSSPQKAEREMIRMLEDNQPVCIYADMGFLPHLGMPNDFHFGEHAIVIAAYDAQNRQVLISDIDPQMSGYKQATLSLIQLDQLRLARHSPYKPFPPKNRWFTFDFSQARPPRSEEIYAAINQAATAMTNPPIKNLGASGIQIAAQRLRRWEKTLDFSVLADALFNLYVFVEIGGTGGGLFRYMYSRFLAEAAQLTGDARLQEYSQTMHACADLWHKIASPLAQVHNQDFPTALLPDTATELEVLAAMEAQVWEKLAACTQSRQP